MYTRILVALVTNMRYAYQLLKRMKPNLIQIYKHEQILELLKLKYNLGNRI